MLQSWNLLLFISLLPEIAFHELHSKSQSPLHWYSLHEMFSWPIYIGLSQGLHKLLRAVATGLVSTLIHPFYQIHASLGHRCYFQANVKLVGTVSQGRNALPSWRRSRTWNPWRNWPQNGWRLSQSWRNLPVRERKAAFAVSLKNRFKWRNKFTPRMAWFKCPSLRGDSFF